MVHPPASTPPGPGQSSSHLEHLLNWKSFSKSESFLLQGKLVPSHDHLLSPQCWQILTSLLLGPHPFAGPRNPI